MLSQTLILLISFAGVMPAETSCMTEMPVSYTSYITEPQTLCIASDLGNWTCAPVAVEGRPMDWECVMGD